MATLTYDPTPADQPEFTEDELNSIEVGEQLAQQQEQLLAGKYENAQELEKAYLELQSKMGNDQEEVEEEPEAESEEVEESEEEVEEETEEAEYEITDQDIEALQNVVGGAEEYAQIIEWAQDNLSEQEISMYDHVMESNDPIAMFFAIRALGNYYVNAVGADAVGKRELMTNVIDGAADIICDDPEQAFHSGELQYVNRLPYFEVLTLSDLIKSHETMQLDKGISVFDSTGVAIEDIALAILLYECVNS